MKQRKQSKPAVAVAECQQCRQQQEQLVALLQRLDATHHAAGRLVMWPNTDMRWYAINVSVAGLLHREKQLCEIELCLLEAGIRSEGNIVGAVRRLIERAYQA